MAAGGQLSLGQQGPIFHRDCHLDAGKQQIEFIHHLLVISASASRVTGLEQERKADRELMLIEPAGHRLGPLGWKSPATTRDQAELSSNSTLGVVAGDQTKALNLVGCLDIDGIAKRAGADHLGQPPTGGGRGIACQAAS